MVNELVADADATIVSSPCCPSGCACLPLLMMEPFLFLSELNLELPTVFFILGLVPRLVLLAAALLVDVTPLSVADGIAA